MPQNNNRITPGPLAVPSIEFPRALFALATSTIGLVDRARNSALATRAADVAQASLQSVREGLSAQAALAQESLQETLQEHVQSVRGHAPEPFPLCPPADNDEDPDWDVVTRGESPDWEPLDGPAELFGSGRGPPEDEETLARTWKCLERQLNRAIRAGDDEDARTLRRSMSDIRHRIAFLERARVAKVRREGELWEARERERGEMRGFKREVLRGMGPGVFKKLEVKEKEEEDEEDKGAEEDEDEDDDEEDGDGTISGFMMHNQ